MLYREGILKQVSCYYATILVHFCVSLSLSVACTLSLCLSSSLCLSVSCSLFISLLSLSLSAFLSLWLSRSLSLWLFCSPTTWYLSQARYLCSNSGSSWFNTAFSYQQVYTKSQFLGEYIEPSALTQAQVLELRSLRNSSMGVYKKYMRLGSGV